MLALEVVSLLETLRRLVSRKAELDKEYFENFIQPAWEAFLKVHRDYKTSFREYAELVAQDNYPISTLVERLRQDSIYTRDLRSELWEIIKHIPSARGKTKEDSLSAFSKDMVNYLYARYGIHYVRSGVLDDKSLEHLSNWGPRIFYVGTRSREEKPLQVGYGDDTVDGLPSNVPRYLAIIYLSQKGTRDRDQAKEFLNAIASIIQIRYHKVAGSYYQLRRSLLI